MAMQMLKQRKRAHFVKTQAQAEMLEEEWDKDPNFTAQRIAELAERTGLDKRCIYKWQWDHSKGYHA